ncbi:MAG: ATP-binding protein [Saprospiraceae bacterium]
MKFSSTRNYPLSTQFLISIVGVLLVSAICFYSTELIGYRIVSMILLITVSLIAMLFEILPVLVAAVVSAVIWNFFFIPPLFTFHISNAEDLLIFLLYFSIALVNTVLTFKIRKEETKARDKEERENTIKLYNTLLNSLSHELRTPISTILGAVDMLKESKEALSTHQQEELLVEIDIASMRLNRQVENLLSMSRLESGMLKPKYEWCDLNELIHSLIQKAENGAERRIHFLVNDNLPLFKLDEGLVEQIIHNLLHNALLYTPDTSRIDIEVLHEEEACIITVSDNGMGFSALETSLVFDKFYRLPHSRPGGSGLGLSIVKGFVEALDGKVKLENNERGGAKFTVEIPAETSYISNLKNE